MDSQHTNLVSTDKSCFTVSSYRTIFQKIYIVPKAPAGLPPSPGSALNGKYLKYHGLQGLTWKKIAEHNKFMLTRIRLPAQNIISHHVLSMAGTLLNSTKQKLFKAEWISTILLKSSAEGIIFWLAFRLGSLAN